MERYGFPLFLLSRSIVVAAMAFPNSCLIIYRSEPQKYIQVHLEGKYVVDIDKSIDITNLTPSTRVALRNDSYVLHLGHFLFCLPVILSKFLPVLVHLGAMTVHE
ncbi:unnamed protein product [Camellia sinensis]